MHIVCITIFLSHSCLQSPTLTPPHSCLSVTTLFLSQSCLQSLNLAQSHPYPTILHSVRHSVCAAHVCKWLGTGPGVVLLPTVFRVLVDSLPDEAPILWAAHSPNRNHHVCHTSDGNACVGVNDAAAVLAAVGDLAMRSDRLCAVDQGLAVTGL